MALAANEPPQGSEDAVMLMPWSPLAGGEPVWVKWPFGDLKDIFPKAMGCPMPLEVHGSWSVPSLIWGGL